jgi:excisionase family DNA binding protein
VRPASDLLTTRQTASALGCSQSMVKKMIGGGTLPSIKVGNEHRIPVDAVVVARGGRPLPCGQGPGMGYDALAQRVEQLGERVAHLESLTTQGDDAGMAYLYGRESAATTTDPPSRKVAGAESKILTKAAKVDRVDEEAIARLRYLRDYGRPEQAEYARTRLEKYEKASAGEAAAAEWDLDMWAAWAERNHPNPAVRVWAANRPNRRQQ